jgi:hypothetical protein
MKPISYLLLGAALLLARAGFAQAPLPPPERLLIVSPAVGEVIDGPEKARFGLFLYYAADDFVEARFYRSLAADSAITLRSRLRDGRLVARPFTRAEFLGVRTTIERRLQELGQQVPVAAPVVPGQAPAIAPGTVATGLGTSEFLGRTYSVELASGNAFVGMLVAATPQELEFETKDLGKVRIQRINLKQMVLLTTTQAQMGYDDVGNGNRLFFGPTARNLRKGEGAVQDVYIFLLGVNYGITDNISMGTLFSWIPGAGSDNLFALTPKLSFPVGDKVHVGGGMLLFFQRDDSFNLTYANTTYGSADNNLTAGVGYVFVRGEYVSTPIFMLGGAARVARRISLMNETYILSVTDQFSKATLVGGIMGVRVAAPRISGSLGLMYGFYSYSDRYSSAYSPSSQNDGGAVPFAELTFRFGKLK